METKFCKLCQREKPIDLFYPRVNRTHRYHYCYPCMKEENRLKYRKYKENSPFKHRCAYIASSAKRKNLSFDLTPEYLESIWTGYCPITNEKITLHGNRKDNNHAELDRLEPSKGYTKGNVNWISRRMNRIKSDASLEDLQKLVEFISLNTLRKNYA